MNILKHSIVILIFFNLLSCKNDNTKNNTVEASSTNLEIDHLNIWVKNPQKAKQKLIDIGFTSIPDSLSAVHIGQGTAGRYFYFLNNYLELIIVNNQEELEQNNVINKELDFTKRANFHKNGASPFSIALKLKDYKVEKIPFENIEYHQDWMEDNGSIYSAKNSKINLNEPSIFVIYPEIQSGKFESMTELDNFPSDADDSWKDFFKHKNGAKRITKIIITSKDLNAETKTMKAVNGIKNLIVKNGNKHLMELYFDDNMQNKSFDLRPELPLIIYM